MLAIRLQRLGRKTYPVYRLAVQESQRHPTSGRVVAYVGSYNPHTKEVNVQVEAAQKFLDNGAQPSPRVVKLLRDAGVVLPKWVKDHTGNKHKVVKSSEKLRKNRPKQEPVVEEPVVEVAEVVEAPADETPVVESVAEEPVVEEAPTKEKSKS